MGTSGPTYAPTSCEDDRTWYLTGNGRACTNGDSPEGNVYASADECCDGEFPASWNGDGYDSTCLRIDRCCEMMFSTWYWRPGQGVCSNAPVFGAPDEFTYDNYSDCCEDRFGSSRPNRCSSIDACYPVPAETPVPTPSPTACLERKWHASGNKCTNCDMLDKASNDMINWSYHMVFHTLLDCCEETFGFGVMCKYDDVCFEDTD